MDRNVVIVIVLVVLVLLTAVQAIQLSAVKSQVQSGKVNVANTPSSSGAGNSVPSSVQDLPNMVGGC